MRTWTTHSFRLRLVGTASFSAPARGLEEETPPSLGFCAVPAAPHRRPVPIPSTERAPQAQLGILKRRPLTGSTPLPSPLRGWAKAGGRIKPSWQLLGWGGPQAERVPAAGRRAL